MRRVVLCRPSGPRNVGAALRATANFGPAELVLVAPERPSILIHPDFEQMAHGVDGGAERVRVVETLEEALADCTGAVGFTSRARDHRRLASWARCAEGFRARGADPEELLALVFGSEVAGLTGAECDLMHELCHLSTADEHTSLNLATAVALVLHDTFESSREDKKSGGNVLLGADREYLKRHVAHVLGGAALSDRARRDIEDSVMRVFSQAYLEKRDARAWHQIMRALGSRLAPADFGLGPGSVSGDGAETASQPTADGREA